MSIGDRSRSVYHGLVGAKIDPISEIRNSGLLTSGSAIWVKDPDDADYITFKDAVGRDNFADTIQGGIDLTRNDKNDYVFVCPKDDGSDWTLGTALDINKDRVHLVSVGYTQSVHGYSNTLRYNMGTTPDTELINITGQGVEIAGFEILGTLGTDAGGTMSNALVYLGTAASGTPHGLNIHDVAIRANHSHGTPPLVSAAERVDGVTFNNVVFEAIGDAPENALVVLPHSGKRWEFDRCRFLMEAQATGDNFIEAGTGATDYALFSDSSFINVEDGTAPASAVVGSVTVNNPVLIQNCAAVNVTAMGTDPTVFVSPVSSGTAAEAYDPGISVGTALNVAS